MAKKEKKEKKEKKSKKEKKEKKEKKGRRGRKEKSEREERTPKMAYDSAMSTLGGFVCAYAIFLLLAFILILVYAVLTAL